MTNLEWVKNWAKEEEAKGLVDIKFCPGPNAEASNEEIATEVKHMLTAQGRKVERFGF